MSVITKTMLIIFMQLLLTDSAFARYIQADPIGSDQDYSDPAIQVAIKNGVLLNRRKAPGKINHPYVYGNSNPNSNFDPFGLICTTDRFGNRVCDSASELGYGEKYSHNGDNSAFPKSTNNACVQECIKQEMPSCLTPTSARLSTKDALEMSGCVSTVVMICTQKAANCPEPECEN